MDLSVLQDLIPDLAGFLKIDPATLLLYVGMICTACNIVGRLIPDDKTGPLGTIRDICKMIGFYAPNRVASGISVNDVARSIVSRADPDVKAAAEDREALIPEVAEGFESRAEDDRPIPVGEIVPAFPGLAETDRRGRDTGTGKFVARPIEGAGE